MEGYEPWCLELICLNMMNEMEEVEFNSVIPRCFMIEFEKMENKKEEERQRRRQFIW